MAERAVLLVGHGTVADPKDVPAFLQRIRHGRPAPVEFVEEIARRYRVIGRSPLLETTERVASALSAELGVPARVAMRFWDPPIDDALRRAGAEGVDELAVLPVAPFSVDLYADVVEAAARDLAGKGERVPRLLRVPPYGDDPLLVGAQASAIRPHLAGRNAAETTLVLSAHSLPLRVLASGDRYRDEFEACSRAIAAALGWQATLAYQSQGEGGGEWIGPTLVETFARARTGGAKAVVVAPVGFLADHVETLYDLDVEAKGMAEGLGLEFVRVQALNDSPALVTALAALCARTFEAGA
jgi:ferrochelatase